MTKYVVYCMSIAIAFITFIFGCVAHRDSSEETRIEWTRSMILTTETAVNVYESRFGRYPDSLEELAEPNGEFPALLGSIPTDTWGNQLKFKMTGEHDFLITSAGPDMKFGTLDDLTN